MTTKRTQPKLPELVVVCVILGASWFLHYFYSAFLLDYATAADAATSHALEGYRSPQAGSHEVAGFLPDEVANMEESLAAFREH